MCIPVRPVSTFICKNSQKIWKLLAIRTSFKSFNTFCEYFSFVYIRTVAVMWTCISTHYYDNRQSSRFTASLSEFKSPVQRWTYILPVSRCSRSKRGATCHCLRFKLKATCHCPRFKRGTKCHCPRFRRGTTCHCPRSRREATYPCRVRCLRSTRGATCYFSCSRCWTRCHCRSRCPCLLSPARSAPAAGWALVYVVTAPIPHALSCCEPPCQTTTIVSYRMT